jgi:hypothetical protein
MARAPKKTVSWKSVRNRETVFHYFLQRFNATPHRFHIDVRGPQWPQGILLRHASGRAWRVVAKGGINVFRAVADGKPTPLTPTSVTRFEYLHSPTFNVCHPRLDLLAACLIGRTCSLETWAEITDLWPEKLRHLQEKAPEVFARKPLDGAAVFEWFNKFDDSWITDLLGRE